MDTSREGFRVALDVSAYSLVALTRAVVPLMERRGGGSIVTLTYLGSQRVFTNYNVMGVAKAALEASVRYLASDLGRATSVSMPYRRVPSRRWRRPASQGFRTFFTCIGIERPFGGTSMPPRWQMPSCSCWVANPAP